MWLFAVFPFFLQAIVIFFDEFYFHVKRGLPKWERIGHPIDTFSVLICFFWILFFPFNALHLKIYIALSAFSCVLVTKDEFVHKHFCPASENWLHALLFILHPIVLTLSGMIWAYNHGVIEAIWIQKWLNSPIDLKLFIQVQTLVMTLFLLYQIIYWNFIWKKNVVMKH